MIRFEVALAIIGIVATIMGVFIAFQITVLPPTDIELRILSFFVSLVRFFVILVGFALLTRVINEALFWQISAEGYISSQDFQALRKTLGWIFSWFFISIVIQIVYTYLILWATLDVFHHKPEEEAPTEEEENFTGVLHQQGEVLLDRDWNDQIDVEDKKKPKLKDLTNIGIKRAEKLRMAGIKDVETFSKTPITKLKEILNIKDEDLRKMKKESVSLLKETNCLK